jgi:hypothetical protein
VLQASRPYPWPDALVILECANPMCCPQPPIRQQVSPNRPPIDPSHVAIRR